MIDDADDKNSTLGTVRYGPEGRHRQTTLELKQHSYTITRFIRTTLAPLHPPGRLCALLVDPNGFMLLPVANFSMRLLLSNAAYIVFVCGSPALSPLFIRPICPILDYAWESGMGNGTVVGSIRTKLVLWPIKLPCRDCGPKTMFIIIYLVEPPFDRPEIPGQNRSRTIQADRFVLINDFLDSLDQTADNFPSDAATWQRIGNRIEVSRTTSLHAMRTSTDP
uniref:Uncharacterized protein n=1 Tax=Anopheles farauti TaxID=69004 RepID=A0A182Q8B7_9DIPT